MIFGRVNEYLRFLQRQLIWSTQLNQSITEINLKQVSKNVKGVQQSQYTSFVELFNSLVTWENM